MKHPVIIDPHNNIQDTYKKVITAPGLQKLASLMTQPLRLKFDYRSIGSKTFLADQLPTPSPQIYVDKYLHNEISIDQHNKIQQRRHGFQIKKVMFPVFSLSNNPTISLKQIKHRRFTLIDR